MRKFIEIAFGLYIITALVLSGCTVTSKREINLSQPVDYDYAFDAAIKSALDLNLDPEPDKSSGLLKARQVVTGGLRGAKGVEVYFDRSGQKVKNIRITAGSGGGSVPHFQSEADTLIQQYIEALNKYLE